MSDPAAGLRLQVEPDLSALEPTRLAVLAFLAPHALSAQALYAVELVLEEVLTNQIKYAFAGRTTSAVALSVDVARGDVVIGFADDGLAFDPLQAAEPVWPSSLQQAQVGGLGLMLVQRLAKSAAYERVDERNRLTITIEGG